MRVSLRSLMSSYLRRPMLRPSGLRLRPLNRPGPAVGHSAVGVGPLENRVLLSVDVLTPVADTFVRDNEFAGANFGNSPLLYVKTAGSGDSRVALLKFDVGNWSAAQIGNATLYLAGALQTPTTPPITTAIFPVNDSTWVEGNGTIAVRSQNGGF